MAIFGALAALDGGRLAAATHGVLPRLTIQQAAGSGTLQGKPTANQASQPRPVEGQRGFGPVPGPAGPAGPRANFFWWKDAAVLKEIGLVADQAAKIDKIYERRRKQIQLQVDEFEKLRTDLNRMIDERIVTPDVIELQAQKMVALQNPIDISRIKMLYEMSLVMTPAQNKKLDEIRRRMYEQRDRERARGRNPLPR